MKRLLCLVIIMLSFLFVSCTNPDGARRVLEENGYENIQIGGYGFFKCSKDDSISTSFSATVKGKTVTGTVCEGFLLKGKTIRFN